MELIREFPKKQKKLLPHSSTPRGLTNLRLCLCFWETFLSSLAATPLLEPASVALLLATKNLPPKSERRKPACVAIWVMASLCTTLRGEGCGPGFRRLGTRPSWP